VLVRSGENGKVNEAIRSQGGKVRRVEWSAEEVAARMPELKFGPAGILSFFSGYR
jgi:hypothetical protein